MQRIQATASKRPVNVSAPLVCIFSLCSAVVSLVLPQFLCCHQQNMIAQGNHPKKLFSKPYSLCIITHTIRSFMLCRASVFSRACRSICFIHFFFLVLFHESKSQTLLPSGWTTHRRWKALLLFSLPYAPETVPSSASDYPRAQMLRHPLPPEMLNWKICLRGMGAQSLEGLGCECKDLIIIAAINKCSRNYDSVLSTQGSELLRNKTKKCTRLLQFHLLSATNLA